MDIRAAFTVRSEVFIRETGVEFREERDVLDRVARHYLAWDESRRPVGTARAVVREAEARISRVAVLRGGRGQGVGTALVEAAHADLATIGVRRVWLHAQVTVEGFFRRLGYRVVGGVFLEAGIEHVRMERPLGSPPPNPLSRATE